MRSRVPWVRYPALPERLRGLACFCSISWGRALHSSMVLSQTEHRSLCCTSCSSAPGFPFCLGYCLQCTDPALRSSARTRWSPLPCQVLPSAPPRQLHLLGFFFFRPSWFFTGYSPSCSCGLACNENAFGTKEYRS